MTVSGRLPRPGAMLFDWHGTLVDTVDSMYCALDGLFPRLDQCGLLERLGSSRCRTPEEAELVNYVRLHKQLHPRVKALRKLSRTDIFEILFGADPEAKAVAHDIYDDCYRAHCGQPRPFEQGIRHSLHRFKERGLRLGIVTNRNREFLLQELSLVEAGSWQNLFDVIVCGDDIPVRKPAADGVFAALQSLGFSEAPWLCWNVGDSTADVAAARRARAVAIFYNGARWEREHLQQMFPESTEFPEVPHAVVESFAALERLTVTLAA